MYMISFDTCFVERFICAPPGRPLGMVNLWRTPLEIISKRQLPEDTSFTFGYFYMYNLYAGTCVGNYMPLAAVFAVLVAKQQGPQSLGAKYADESGADGHD